MCPPKKSAHEKGPEIAAREPKLFRRAAATPPPLPPPPPLPLFLPEHLH